MAGYEKIYPLQIPAAFARTRIESICSLDIDSNASPHRSTGIICTIGPASQSIDVLDALMKAGMGVARMNFSHGSYEYHKQTLDNVRDAAARQILPVAIALDTKGPEIRTGVIAAGVNAEVELVRGKPVTVTTDEKFKEACDESTIWVDYDNIVNVMTPGKRILIEDGNMSLVVKEKEHNLLKCEVEFGGPLSSKKGCNLPGTSVDLPAVSEKDKSDLIFGIENGIDMVFASFIRSGDGVRSIRSILGDKGKNVKIISKIETHDGVRKFNDILEASDGIMVARGDLGVEIPTEKVFLAQKMMIGRCLIAGKPIICATQMLESMTKKSRPTRSEASDVANAVLDGADCVMLSGESAKGAFPVVCVETMARICREAESAIYHRQLFEELRFLSVKPADSMKTAAIAAVEASIETMAAAIAVLTTSGRTAQCVSSFRPRCPILAVTRDEVVARQLRVQRGVVPIVYTAATVSPWEKDVEARLQHAIKFGEKLEMVRPGSVVIVIHGSRAGTGNTDTIRLIHIPKK